MIKSDKYYLKNGRLDLSMLEDDVEMAHHETPQEDLTGVRNENNDKNEPCFNQELKIDKDIYRTLHVMGKFLTKANFTPKSAPNHQVISKEDKITEVSQKVNLRTAKKYYLNC